MTLRYARWLLLLCATAALIALTPVSAQNDRFQNSAAQNSAAQNSASQNSASQNSASQNSASQNSASQNGASQSGASQSGASQNGASPKIPRTVDGKPDFSGTFQWPTYLPEATRGRSNATIFDSKNMAPLKPGGEAFFEPRTGDPRHDEPRDFCMPAGFPASVLSGNAMQLFQTGNYLVWVHEFQRNTRIIPLDGRPHREGLEPMYDGDPVGRWEGDTLVIDTRNFKRWALDDHHYTNADEFRMHSDALKTVERLRWKSPTVISYSITIDDPKIFTKPWSQEFEIIAKPEWEKDGLFEYVCQENNRCPGGKCGN